MQGPPKTDTFLGERYRRIARRSGSKRAIVAVSRSILVIAWHLLSDPGARFTNLGSGFYATHIDSERRKPGHIRQLEALGYKVTLQPACGCRNLRYLGRSAGMPPLGACVR